MYIIVAQHWTASSALLRHYLTALLDTAQARPVTYTQAYPLLLYSASRTATALRNNRRQLRWSAGFFPSYPSAFFYPRLRTKGKVKLCIKEAGKGCYKWGMQGMDALQTKNRFMFERALMPSLFKACGAWVVRNRERAGGKLYSLPDFKIFFSESLRRLVYLRKFKFILRST